MDELQLLMEDGGYDFVCLCEHWLNELSVESCNLENYTIANHFSRKDCKGGGVIIYIKNSFKFKKLEIIDNISKEREFEVVAIEIKDLNIVIVCVYRSPNSPLPVFFDSLKTTLDILYKHGRAFFIYGDFNIDLLDSSPSVQEFKNVVTSYGSSFLVSEATRLTKSRKSCLDNCITNVQGSCCASLLDCHMSDHVAVINSFCPIENPSSSTSTQIVKYRPFCDLTVERCVSILSEMSWKFLEDFEDINDMFGCFLTTFLHIYDQCFPEKQKTIKNTNKSKKWFNSELRECRDRLNFLISCNNCHQKLNLTDEIKIAKKNYKNKIITEKKKYYSNKIAESANKPKTVWQIIKEPLSKKASPQDANLTVEEFNEYFTNISRHIIDGLDKPKSCPIDITSSHIHSNKNLFLMPVNPTEVGNIIADLSDSVALDVYGLNNKVLKKLKHGLMVPMAIIINKCFQTGEFPDRLKISKVVPIFKKGDPNEASNYRPISITPVLSKPIEAALSMRISNFLEINNLMHGLQFGFRKKLSTAHAIAELVRRVVESFERGEAVTATFCDLSKAFDCVSHSILLNKLPLYGIRGVVANLISSYLSDRVQMVDHGGARSPALDVTAGVPQGSILGPLLFILYVNELPLHMSPVHTIQYADDTTLCENHHDLAFLEQQAKIAISKVEDFFTANELSLNIDKTNILMFTLKELEDSQKSFRFLGVTLDSRLGWKDHISNLSSKLSSTLYLLRRISDFVPPQVLRTAYMGLFQSRISYGLLFWGQSTDWVKVFILQKTAIRTLGKVKQTDSCRPLFKKFGILPLAALYIYQCLLYVKSQQATLCTVNSRHDYPTRNGDDLLIPHHRLTLTHKSYITLSLKLFNHLSPCIRSLPISNFKIRIRAMLMDLSPYNVEEFLNCDM